MPVRIDVDCDAGDLAASPESALIALCEIAERDGADPHEWLEKALSGAGATTLAVQVSRESPYQIVEDSVQEAMKAADLIASLMREAVKERLMQAVRDAEE